jgi:tetratricopeptide (TPR) repeat protein
MSVGVQEPGAPAASSEPTEADGKAARKAVFTARRGKALEASGHYEEAIKRYREALEIWPHLTPVWAQLGRAYLNQKDYAKAQIALQRAIEIDPNSTEAMNDLGVAQLFQNRYDKALELFNASAQLDVQFAPAYFNQALCHLAMSDRTNAWRSLQQYLQFEPGDPKTLKELAFLDAADGRYEDALVNLQKAMVRVTNWPILYFDAAAASALAGKTNDTFNFLQHAESITSPRAVYQMYQEPAFRQLRATERGKNFEQGLAERAREGAFKPNPNVTWMNSREPIVSVSSSFLTLSSGETNY